MTGRRLQLDARAMALMVVLCACWGVNQVAIKVANTGISPVLQAGLRSAGATFLVWAWAGRRGVRLFPRDGWASASLRRCRSWSFSSARESIW
jgi:drug/metabolite transporter (DMT)-like permease